MTRRFVYLWLLPFLFLSVGWAEGALPPPETLEGSFLSGNAFYLGGEFSKAVSVYEGQVQRGKYSANLFFNLGNAYYRCGDRGHAMLNYERALVLEPTHAEAAANLAFLHGKSPTPATGGWDWNAVATVAAVAGWLGAAGWIAVVFVPRMRSVGLAVAVGGGLICASGAAAVWFTNDRDGRVPQAVVVAESAPALYAPADNSKVITTVLAGAAVRVLSEQGAWTYVQLNDGTRAWLAANRVEKLVPASPPHPAKR